MCHNAVAIAAAQQRARRNQYGGSSGNIKSALAK